MLQPLSDLLCALWSDLAAPKVPLVPTSRFGLASANTCFHVRPLGFRRSRIARYRTVTSLATAISQSNFILLRRYPRTTRAIPHGLLP
jgi:hypothetical protein